jgi:hypothetical protein
LETGEAGIGDKIGVLGSSSHREGEEDKEKIDPAL